MDALRPSKSPRGPHGTWGAGLRRLGPVPEHPTSRNATGLLPPMTMRPRQVGGGLICVASRRISAAPPSVCGFCIPTLPAWAPRVVLFPAPCSCPSRFLSLPCPLGGLSLAGPLHLSPAMARVAAPFGWLAEKIKIPISQKTAKRSQEKKLDKSRWWLPNFVYSIKWQT